MCFTKFQLFAHLEMLSLTHADGLAVLWAVSSWRRVSETSQKQRQSDKKEADNKIKIQL